MLKVLVVEDEPDLCSLIADALLDEGHEVVCAKDGAEAMTAASAATFDLLLADIRLPKVDGLTLFRWLRSESPDTDAIVMTGNAAVGDAVTVLKEGAFDYLTKPINLDELGIQLQRLAAFRSLTAGCGGAPHRAGGSPVNRERLVGHSPGMLKLVKRMDAIAPSDAAVVITGESGTGKELVARALHEGGGRRSKPFVAVNCAAFPDTLIEAELFGHERGAFTGATNRREGRFKAATAAPCFSTRWRSCLRRRRRSCCGCCKRERSSRSAATTPSRWTCESSRRPTATSARASRKGCSARICTTESTPSISRFRRCAVGATISPCWCSTSSGGFPIPRAPPRASPGEPGTRWRRTRFPAMSAS